MYKGTKLDFSTWQNMKMSLKKTALINIWLQTKKVNAVITILSALEDSLKDVTQTRSVCWGRKMKYRFTKGKKKTGEKTFQFSSVVTLVEPIRRHSNSFCTFRLSLNGHFQKVWEKNELLIFLS